MKTKVFKLNDDNKVEFTEKELKELLDEIYNDGYEDGKNNNSYVYYSTPYRPYRYTYPYITWCSSSQSGSTSSKTGTTTINITGNTTSTTGNTTSTNTEEK